MAENAENIFFPFMPGADIASIPVEIVRKKLATASFTFDGRWISPHEMENIFKNTNEQILNRGFLIPVRIEHSSMNGDPELKGFIQKIELEKDDIGDPVVLWGELALFKDFFDRDYKKAKFPQLSIGTSSGGSDENGNEFSDYLDHVALLGGTSPAFPWLFEKMDDFKKFFSKRTGSMNDTQKKLLSEFSNFADRAKELEKMAETVPVSSENGPTDIDKALLAQREELKLVTEEVIKGKALMADYNKEQVEIEFDKLKADNRITDEEKASFLRIVETNDIEFAKSMFNKVSEAKPQPPETKELESKRDISNKNQVERDMYEAQAVKMGLPRATIDEYMKTYDAEETA